MYPRGGFPVQEGGFSERVDVYVPFGGISEWIAVQPDMKRFISRQLPGY